MSDEKRTDDKKITQSDKRKAFATNIRWACDRMEFGSYKEAAEKMQVRYAWLRRAATRGIAWTKTSNDSVTNLAKFFDVNSEMLWDSSGKFQIVVLKKSKPDYTDHCMALEAVLRHHWRERPPLLDQCLKIINQYKLKLDDPNNDDPRWMFTIVEKAELKPGDTLWSAQLAIRESHLRAEFEKRLIQMRLLPRPEVLEQVIRERFVTLERQKHLERLHSDFSWTWGGARREVVKMLECIFFEALQSDGDTLSDDKRKGVTAVAESFAKKLWDGEYRANV